MLYQIIPSNIFIKGHLNGQRMRSTIKKRSNQINEELACEDRRVFLKLHIADNKTKGQIS